jgi:hypothetical protein
MPSMCRKIILAALLPLTLALAGCETSGFWDSANNISDRFSDALSDFNPFGTAKKPLPGERRAVFPEGVPGVQQGVPPELMRGNQQAVETTQTAPPPQAAAEPKGKSRKVAKKTRTQAPAEEPEAEPAEEVWPPPPSGNRGR